MQLIFKNALLKRNTLRTSYLIKTILNQLDQQFTNLQTFILPKQQVDFSISVEQLNDHFSTVAKKVITKNSTSNDALDKLQEFCQSRNI